jgi:hypothetical protein
MSKLVGKTNSVHRLTAVPSSNEVEAVWSLIRCKVEDDENSEFPSGTEGGLRDFDLVAFPDEGAEAITDFAKNASPRISS